MQTKGTRQATTRKMRRIGGLGGQMAKGTASEAPLRKGAVRPWVANQKAAPANTDAALIIPTEKAD